jgi:pentose-5-phosphate-3-epimerase
MADSPSRHVTIAPSLPAADFGRLEQEFAANDWSGADTLIAGTAVFHAPDHGQAIAEFRGRS